MAVKIGIIAEDESDVQVLKILLSKVYPKKFAVNSFVGKGCGKLKVKALPWAKSLHTKGCDRLLLVHDRDRHDEVDLRKQLEAVLANAPQIKTSVVIPVEELEGWLLSDEKAIKKALKLKSSVAEIHHPENTASPKEFLGKMVSAASRKIVTYVNTVHNPLIASEIDVSKIQKKCPSFARITDFFSK